MNIESYFEYCLSKKGVTEHFPFDKDTLVFKVGGKMFALASLKEWEAQNAAVNLKNDPDRNEELRANYDGINPGYHMSKIHWITVAVNKGIPDAFVRQLIDESYDCVYNGLTKKIRAQIEADR